MARIFADRMSCVRKSFVREILEVTEDSDMISFAGGAPLPVFSCPGRSQQLAKKVLSECCEAALQYATSEGYLALK